MSEADVRWKSGRSSDTVTAGNSSGRCSVKRTMSVDGLFGAGLRKPLVASFVVLQLLLAIVLNVPAASASSDAALLSARITADLAERNITQRCEAEHLCLLDQKRPRIEQSWEERGCLCDLECGTYGDCCRDAPAAGNQSRDDITCHVLRHYDGIYMVSSCPSDWSDAGVARRCAEPPSLSEDPFGALPVTSPNSRMTYRNYYCAMCHGDVQGAEFWRTRVECPTLTSQLRDDLNVTEAFTMENLQQNSLGQWGITIGEGDRETFHECELDPFFTETIEFLLRRCRVSISSCASNWTDAGIADLCGAYTAYVYDYDNEVYRNPHCALCNHLPPGDIDCMRRPMLRSRNFGNRFNTRSFAILMDVGDRSGSEEVGAVTVCADTQLWDPFFKICRDVVCDAAGFILRDGVCVQVEDFNVTDADEDITNSTDLERPISNATQATEFLLCPKYFLNGSDFEVRDNSTVYVPLYDRTYSAGQFELRDGELVICAVSADLSKFDQALSYISLLCLAASVICLTLHLLAFCLVSEIRNLSGKNLAALSVCLLVGYICFLVMPSQTPGEPGCAALAVIMYAAFIASFFWMNIMAFDVFTTLRKATKELRVASGRHLGRFLLYTIYVTLMTSAVLAAAMIAEHGGSTPAAYRPGFGDRVCWFSRRRALMAFFAVPLAAVMGINVVLFVSSALMIRETTRSTQSMTCGPSKVNLRLYSRLAVIMGLSWVVGLVAGWLDFPPLWYAFVVLNTLQGVFIFVSFTLAEKVRHKVSRAAASWTSGGGERSLTESNVNTDSSGLTVTKTRM
ncbi:uncharacterized protein LOC122372985 [Amphibalanus amphitrite]|uniref:uncharacterized protein LOC122372985 n=1 Tax=Amphibalanus amphitrite TaxID=1232801 RepID=UPI001C905E7A|nr:uncharacterized protein LOC122372985 [Amphibalanus amphitrite]